MPIPFLFQQQTGLAKVLNGSQFYAPRTSSITQTRGSGTPTITRATPATVLGYAPAAVLADGKTLLTVASGELRHQGARRISEGVWSTVDADGVPIPSATLDGSVVEAAATQYLGVTGTPATQTTASLGTGTYTLWCEGTGSCIASAGTATITGEAAAEEDSHNTFTVTGAGTVTVTVTGSLTFFQLENSPYPTQRIDNAGAVGTSATRNKDVLDDQVSGNLTAAAGSVAFQWTPSHAPSGTVALAGSYVDASNYTMLLAQKVTNLILGSSDDLTAAPWGLNGGPTSVTASSITFSASAENGVVNPSITAAATGAQVFIIKCKAWTDSGTKQFRLQITKPSVANYTSGDLTATTTPTDFYYVATTAAGAASTDAYIINGSDASTGKVNFSEVVVEEVTNNVSQFPAPYVSTATGSSTFAIFRKVIAGAAYDAYLAHAYVSGTTYDIALKWGASGSNLAVDGVLGTAHANTTAAQLGTRWQWGADGNGGQQAGAAIKEKFMWTRALSDSELQATTA